MMGHGWSEIIAIAQTDGGAPPLKSETPTEEPARAPEPDTASETAPEPARSTASSSVGADPFAS